MSRPLILAIEPDGRRGSQIQSIAGQVSADILVVKTAAQGVTAFDSRLPDLILTPALLSRRDEALLTDRLRALGDGAAHIQTLTIPILETAAAPARGSSVLSALRRGKGRAASPAACEVDRFAEQVAVYLERAVAMRRAQVVEAVPPRVLDIEPEPAAPEPVYEHAYETAYEAAPETADEPGSQEPGQAETLQAEAFEAETFEAEGFEAAPESVEAASAPDAAPQDRFASVLFVPDPGEPAPSAAEPWDQEDSPDDGPAVTAAAWNAPPAEADPEPAMTIRRFASALPPTAMHVRPPAPPAPQLTSRVITESELTGLDAHVGTPALQPADPGEPDPALTIRMFSSALSASLANQRPAAAVPPDPMPVTPVEPPQPRILDTSGLTPPVDLAEPEPAMTIRRLSARLQLDESRTPRRWPAFDTAPDLGVFDGPPEPRLPSVEAAPADAVAQLGASAEFLSEADATDLQPVSPSDGDDPLDALSEFAAELETDLEEPLLDEPSAVILPGDLLGDLRGSDDPELAAMDAPASSFALDAPTWFDEDPETQVAAPVPQAVPETSRRRRDRRASRKAQRQTQAPPLAPPASIEAPEPPAPPPPGIELPNTEEWQYFDPNHYRFARLIAKLDEITAG